jgi:hypothetical protein
MGQIADILQARGQLDEALRIRREEQLPVYDRLGDVRSRAVTMGKIADILQARGQLDEALRIRREEELPVYDRLGDVRERAVALFKIATALIDAGGLANGQQPDIIDALRDAFSITLELRIPDGIATVGLEFAKVLSQVHRRQDALAVLDEAEKACAVLGDPHRILAAQQLRRALTQPAPKGS